MPYLPMTEYETASDEVRHEYDDQIAKHGRITNMKRTLLQSPSAFHAYMEWYTLKDLLVPFIGERGVSLFSYAISTANDCLVCSTFFRKILIDAGEDPDELELNETEQLLWQLGRAISETPHDIPQQVYDELEKRYNAQQRVLLFSFAGIMAATNLFNTIAKIPLDEALFAYTKENTTEEKDDGRI